MPDGAPAIEVDGLPGGICRPKVLLLVTLSEWGGAQYVVYLLAKHLARQYDVSVACAPGGELIPRLLRDGIRTYAVPELVRRPSPWRDLRALLRLGVCAIVR